jgi:hypothetical protein
VFFFFFELRGVIGDSSTNLVLFDRGRVRVDRVLDSPTSLRLSGSIGMNA